MSTKWKYKTTFDYKMKSYGVVIVVWIAFNLGASLLTGNTKFPDNYLFLTVLIVISAVRNSYAVSYKDGQMNTIQLGMITGNIDLYKANEVKEENGVIRIYAENNSQFSIPYKRLPKHAHEEILSSIKPFYGEKPEIIEAPASKAFIKKTIKAYNQSILAGVVLGGIALVGAFTDVLYLPSWRGPVYRSDGTDNFFVLFGFCVLLSIFSIVHGVLGKRKCKNL
ncbi:hypothetical protein [Sessilibacter corallicola]|uniref:Uncharacterized protein n=2 Tax=Sessilibacter corallicola TaxID=2904075 RepID=A0ABQ0A9C6_9GAMM